MLSNFQIFVDWLLNSLSNFLTSEPICYFIYLIIFAIILKFFFSLMNMFNRF